MCNKWPRMTFPCIFLGTLTEAVGLGVLAWAIYANRLSVIYGMMALVGCGSGMRFMASPLHGIGLFRHLRASVIGLMAVAIPFGGTIGLTIMSTVFNNTSGLDSHSDFSSVHSSSNNAANEQAVHQAKMGVVWAFVAITPLVALVSFRFFFSCLGWELIQDQAFPITWFIGNVKLGQGPPGEDGPTDIVVKGSYLLKLVRGQEKLKIEKNAYRLNSSHSGAWSEAVTSDQSVNASRPLQGSHQV
ncbi:hypothetical protein LB503_000573 [Fusarium chuoi]|nr:hypothetical protein LB503_000573 [Fusarium chuoi]